MFISFFFNGNQYNTVLNKIIDIPQVSQRTTRSVLIFNKIIFIYMTNNYVLLGNPILINFKLIGFIIQCFSRKLFFCRYKRKKNVKKRKTFNFRKIRVFIKNLWHIKKQPK